MHQKKELEIVLRALFQKNNSDNITLTAQSSDKFIDIKDDNLPQLIRCFCDDDLQYTLDQQNAIVSMYKTLWALKPSSFDLSIFRYSDSPSPFNALLHFMDGGDTLNERNGVLMCTPESILRWHSLCAHIEEDLLVCAYKAAKDIKDGVAGRRNDFAWHPFIPIDDNRLNTILDMPLADIHAHLKGSSLNFSLNWICLMNHIDDRLEQFTEIGKKHQADKSTSSEKLYLKVVQAAAIRLFLFSNILDKKFISPDLLERILSYNDIPMVSSLASDLQRSISVSLSSKLPKQYTSSKETSVEVLDYAIIEGYSVLKSKEESCAYSILSGERWFMYEELRRIYADLYKDCKLPSLFYKYLLIKNEIRHEISQLNETVGFENFNVYEKRKLVFVDVEDEIDGQKVKLYPAYESAAIHLAVASFFSQNPSSRYHETRIAPKQSGDAILKSIINNDKAIESDLFKKKNENWEYRYIFHFIKQADDPIPKNSAEKVNIDYRHKKLREEVETSSRAISEFRRKLNKTTDSEAYISDRVVGIDAANSEIVCRPEVFAQAFRYLRNDTYVRPDNSRTLSLGCTFHVGEDFMDVVDGLRAVDEALQFLGLKQGDRIGHALALGVDVEIYYKSRNYSIPLSLQMQMDNLAWLHHKLGVLKKYPSLQENINGQFASLYKRVSPDEQESPHIEIYYKSMLLRGDNPCHYLKPSDGVVFFNGVDTWNKYSITPGKECLEARRLKKARELYHQYHYDKQYRINAEQIDIMRFDDDQLLEAIADVQRMMLNEVESRRIAIECNPTSNFKIGDFDRYDKHPIRKFNNECLDELEKHSVSVSINTDDKGVFATSIEREYALIAHAFIRYYRDNDKQYMTPYVYDWIDRIRRYSLEQSFYKAPEIKQYLEDKAHCSQEESHETDVMQNIKNLSFCERFKLIWKILLNK